MFSLQFFLVIVAFFVQKSSSSKFADVAIAFHVDDYFDQTSVDNCKKLVEELATLFELGPGFDETRMALVFGASSGETNVVVSLADGNSIDKLKNADWNLIKNWPSQKAKPNPKIEFSLDPIFERWTDLFDGRRHLGGDRLEAVDFKIVFIVNSSSADLSEFKENAEVIVESKKSGSQLAYTFNDWNSDNAKTFTNHGDLAKAIFDSSTKALDTCSYSASWRACQNVAKNRCPCVRQVEFENMKSGRFCPKRADDVPCDDKDCKIQQHLGPLTKAAVILIVFAALMLATVVFWPICCCGLYYVVRHYVLYVLEMVVDEGGRVVREQLDLKKKELEKEGKSELEATSAVTSEAATSTVQTETVATEQQVTSAESEEEKADSKKKKVTKKGKGKK